MTHQITGGQARHTLLMGDPEHFRIRGGLNPYTRDRWGRKKKVNRALARSQWLRLKETFEKIGANVLTLEGHAAYPGMVFPANAGFLHPKYEPIPLNSKTFVLSHLAGHRAGERVIYKDFFERMELRLDEPPYLFEGEADFFPCGEFFIFTYGDIVSTGFRPAWGLPPWRFRFSHRSDARNLDFLKKTVAPSPVIALKLRDTRYYHGDTALFAFGPKRENLFAYLEAFTKESQDELKKVFGKSLFPLSRLDAENFVLNSFQIDSPDGPTVVFPAAVSECAVRAVNDAGLGHVTADVSEFFSTGGGSIKCMLCDLGPQLPSAVRLIREDRDA